MRNNTRSALLRLIFHNICFADIFLCEKYFVVDYDDTLSVSKDQSEDIMFFTILFLVTISPAKRSGSFSLAISVAMVILCRSPKTKMSEDVCFSPKHFL